MGLINYFINRNRTPLLVHGNFCGPGNDVISQMKRGVQPVSTLDSYCKEHDLAYVNYQDLEDRHKSDRILASKALSRFKDTTSTFKERLASLAVATAMRGKLALGAGLKTLKNKSCPKKKGRRRKKSGNVAKNPKRKRVNGGFLPALVPILAGLSAIGGIGTGVSQIIKNVKDVKRGDLELEELKRHNLTMEKSGRGHLTRSKTTSTPRKQNAIGKKKAKKRGKGFILHQYKRC